MKGERLTSEEPAATRAVTTPAPGPPGDGDGRSAFAVPRWASDVGRWSGVIVLVAVVIVLLFFIVAATKVLVLAALFAVLFGGTFLPVVDWLSKHHVKRGLAAMLVAVFLVLLAIGLGLIIVYSVVKQVPTIDAKLNAA